MTETLLDAILAPSRPIGNRVIHITVKGLAAVDGSKLNGPIESYFTTAFSPFYSNVMRVRMLAGEFLSNVPDDTINQIVHYFSRQADFLNYLPETASVDPNSYANYRSRWVTASAIVSLLSGSSVNGMMQKRLGDFSIKRDKQAEELFRYHTADLQKLTAILQDGGNYGRGPESAVKGTNHPDKPDIARLWAPPGTYEPNGIPSANTSRRFFRMGDGALQSRSKRTFRNK